MNCPSVLINALAHDCSTLKTQWRNRYHTWLFFSVDESISARDTRESLYVLHAKRKQVYGLIEDVESSQIRSNSTRLVSSELYQAAAAVDWTATRRLCQLVAVGLMMLFDDALLLVAD